MARTALALHPENSRYFLFRGRPWFLVCATEHYGSVINRRFDYLRYLDEAADKHQTLTRTFLLFRELQSAVNPYSPCKVESNDFVAPWPRVGPDAAPDGDPRFDLDRWNAEYFDRLHGFVSAAAERDVVIEATLLSNTYSPAVWQLNPLHHQANVNGLPEIHYADYNSLRHREIFDRQLGYVEKIVTELNPYDNVYFEVCNEPGGGVAGHATPAEVDEWQVAVAGRIREVEAGLPNRHLVFGSQAFRYGPWQQFTDWAFTSDVFDAVNIHPLPNTGFQDHPLDMGAFMSKSLNLGQVAEFCADAATRAKPCVLDEDNVATRFRDFDSWTIHRKRAWVALLSGLHYDMIDFTVNCGLENSNEQCRRELRTWMKNLTDFWRAVDFPHARAAGTELTEQPADTTAVAVAVPGDGHYIYLADNRELGQGAGTPVSGRLVLAAPAGAYELSSYSPVGGGWSPAVRVAGGPGGLALDVPEFTHDVVVRVRSLDSA